MRATTTHASNATTTALATRSSISDRLNALLRDATIVIVSTDNTSGADGLATPEHDPIFIGRD
jgi:hypothetical protein